VRSAGTSSVSAVPGAPPPNITSVAEAVSRESVSARLAEVREGLTLLADYL
jgi:hypothetical protein